jgi:hypothetical protein
MAESLFSVRAPPTSQADEENGNFTTLTTKGDTCYIVRT